jgi:hypothetical protein
MIFHSDWIPGADRSGNFHTSDSLAFSLIMFLARKLRVPGGAPMILDIVAKDATWYFLVVFSSHLVLVLTLNIARVSATFLFLGHNQ